MTVINVMQKEIVSTATKHQIIGSWTKNRQGAFLFKDILTIVSPKVLLVLPGVPLAAI